MDKQNIQPFTVKISQAEVDNLVYRIKNTRWFGEDFGKNWDRGVPMQHLKELSNYWANQFDWRKQETQLNRYPQFISEIGGQPIHFYHIRSDAAMAHPLLLLHGYPGSTAEMLPLVEALTSPGEFGNGSVPAFHLIIPSLPGYGFSNPLHSEGWETYRTALAFKELMQRLGYARYGIQAGDIGAGVAQWMGVLDPDHVTGIHINAEAAAIALLGSPLPSADSPQLSASARKRLGRLHHLQKEGRGYLQLLSTKPLTISYALNDSPVGLLAWVAEKFKEWTDESTLADGIDRDTLLTIVSLYWFSGTSFSAANLIYENYHSATGWAPPGSVPTGFAVFDPDGIVKSTFDPQNRIHHWSVFEKGGHFPALETPDVMVADIREFFSESGRGDR